MLTNVQSWFQGCQSCGDAVTYVLTLDGWEPRRRCRECHLEKKHGVIPNVTRTKAKRPRRRK